MVFNNEFMKNIQKDPSENQIYTIEKRDDWKKDLKRQWESQCYLYQNLHLIPNDCSQHCSLCFKMFNKQQWMMNWSVTSWIYDLCCDANRVLCAFCMDYHCKDCMYQHKQDKDQLNGSDDICFEQESDENIDLDKKSD